MKRSFTLLLGLVALLMPFAALAAPVKVEKAAAFATDFFAQSAPSRSAVSLELVWDGEQAGGRSMADPAFYLFNRTDAPGFVLVAGDDATTPILGYSFEHPFSTVKNMPSNLRWWLDGLRNTILAAREAGAPAHNAWASGRSVSRAGDEKRLNTALWDQSEPYNRECPVLPGTTEPAVTGCVQTAAAIICKYNKWPESPAITTAEGYTLQMSNGTRVNLPARTLSTKYDYSLMPDEYPFEIFQYEGKWYYDPTKPLFTEAEGNAVAALMADLGWMDQASYDTSEAGGTAASDSDFYFTMTTHMRYSKAASLLNRVGYNDEEWAAMLRREIDADRPVFYAGAGKEGGHAFVLDGYKGSDQFSFNWGWSGSANGWFVITNLNPAGYAFNSQQSAVFGLVKDETGSSAYEDLLMIGPAGDHDLDYAGLGDLSPKTPIKGLPFTVGVAYLWNMGGATYAGKLNVGHYAADGTFYGTIASQDVPLTDINGQAFTPGKGVGFPKIPCIVTRELAPGDYIMLLYWHNQKQQWEQARAYWEGTTDRIVLLNLTKELLLQGTSIKYDRVAKKLSVKTYAGLKARLIEGSTTAAQIDTTGEWQELSAPAGSYTLTISDAKSGISCSLNVKL